MAKKVKKAPSFLFTTYRHHRHRPIERRRQKMSAHTGSGPIHNHDRFRSHGDCFLYGLDSDREDRHRTHTWMGHRSRYLCNVALGPNEGILALYT